MIVKGLNEERDERNRRESMFEVMDTGESVHQSDTEKRDRTVPRQQLTEVVFLNFIFPILSVIKKSERKLTRSQHPVPSVLSVGAWLMDLHEPVPVSCPSLALIMSDSWTN